MIRDETRRGRPRKHENWTPELFEERAERYFRRCDGRTKEVASADGVVEVADPAPYSVEGLCCYLGVSRETLEDWSGMPDDLGEACRAALLQVTANQVEGGLDGRQTASVVQFVLKNTDPRHYRDRQETEVAIGREAAGLFEALGWSRKSLRE